MSDLDNPPIDILDASPDGIPPPATPGTDSPPSVPAADGPTRTDDPAVPGIPKALREFSPFEKQALDEADISIETASTYPERFDVYDIRELVKHDILPEAAALYAIEFSGYDIAAFVTHKIPPEKANPFREIPLDAENKIILIDAEIEPDVAAEYVRSTRFSSGASIAFFVRNHVPAAAVRTYPERFDDFAIVALYQIGVDGETAAQLPEDIDYRTVIDACENGVNIQDLIRHPGLIELADAPDVPESTPAAAPEPEAPPPPIFVEIPLADTDITPPPDTAPEVPPPDDDAPTGPPAAGPTVDVSSETDVLFTLESLRQRTARRDILSKVEASLLATAGRNHPASTTSLPPFPQDHQSSEILLPISPPKNPGALRRFFNNKLILTFALAASVAAGGTALVIRSHNKTRTPHAERLQPKKITRGCVISEATGNMIQIGCLPLPPGSIPPGESATLPDTILTGEKNGDNKFGVTVEFYVGNRKFSSTRTLFIGIGDKGDLGAVDFEEVQ